MENKNKEAWWRPGLVIFTKVSAYIAGPIVLALIVGKYLDKKYNSAPWIFLGLTLIAFTFSLFSIWKSVVKYMDEAVREEKDKKK